MAPIIAGWHAISGLASRTGRAQGTKRALAMHDGRLIGYFYRSSRCFADVSEVFLVILVLALFTKTTICF